MFNILIQILLAFNPSGPIDNRHIISDIICIVHFIRNMGTWN